MKNRWIRVSIVVLYILRGFRPDEVPSDFVAVLAMIFLVVAMALFIAVEWE